MFIPIAMAVDLETSLLDGSPSTDYYRGDFRIISMSAAWYSEDGTRKTRYLESEDEIDSFLLHVKDKNIPLVAHNIAFERGVSLARFGTYDQQFKFCTQRLSQVYDNGGKERRDTAPMDELDIDTQIAIMEGLTKYNTGLSLGSCVSRILPPEYHGHKKRFHTLIEERGGGKSKGERLDLLTKEELKEYATLDAIVTLELYRTITKEFETIGYDWRLDHQLYLSTVDLTIESKLRGTYVDREALSQHAELMKTKRAEAFDQFRAKFLPYIEKIEAEMIETEIASYTSERGKSAARARLAIEPIRFNPGSTKQLERLFCKELGMEPKFMTQKGKTASENWKPSPSFAARFLDQWGDGGVILKNQKKYLIEQKQAEAILALSAYDNHYHIDIKACGTATGRMAGGISE